MTTTIDAGTILAGKYRIERVLGRGGMGVVVAAHHLQLDDQVAIKFLLPEALQNREAVARFSREARAAVKIKSEHIARVTDVGTLDWGAPYMVMEYLRGSDLAVLLREHGPLSLEDASDYLLQACEAIAEAHTLGIVHRDLKPPNLFLVHRPDGAPLVKVLDFGISKVTSLSGSADDQSMTKTTAIMGSPLYMSPEQLASARDVDLRTDIWALGVIFFELLSGRPPFLADTLPQVCAAILTQDPPSVRDFRPELPVGVDELILACLAKERDARVQTVAQFAARLAPFAPRRSRLSVERITNLSRPPGVSASSQELAPDSEAPLPRGTFAGFGRTARPPASAQWRAVGGLAVGLLVAGALVLKHQTKVAANGGHSEGPSLAARSATPGRTAPPTPSPPSVPPVSATPGVPAPEATPSAPSSRAQQTTPKTAARGTHQQHDPAAHGAPPAATVVVAPAPPVPAATPPSRPAPDCDIPYSYDSRGNKVFKKGCL